MQVSLMDARAMNAPDRPLSRFGSRDSSESAFEGIDSKRVPLEAKTQGLYTAGFAIVIANRMLDQIAGNIGVAFLSSPAVMALGMALLAARALLVALHCKFSDVLIAAGAVALSFISWANSGQSYLPVATISLLGIGNIDIKRLIRQCSIAVFSIVALLGILQLIQMIMYGMASGSTVRANGRVRLSFFFQHPNMLAAYIAMAYLGLTAGTESYRGGSAVFGLILVILCIYITDSRTSVAIMVIYIAFRLLFTARFPKGLAAKVFYACVPLLFTLVAATAAMSTMPDQLYAALQNLLSGRPGYWRLQYDLLGGFTLFGQHALTGTVVVDGWIYNHVTIDSFYAGSLLSLGAWALPVFYLLYLRAGKAAFEKSDLGMIAALFCCALFGFTEIHVADFAVALPMLLLGSGLLAPRNKKRGVPQFDADYLHRFAERMR